MNFLIGVLAGIVASILTSFFLHLLNRRYVRKQKKDIIATSLQVFKEDVLSFAAKLPSINNEYGSLFLLKNKITNASLAIISSGVLSGKEEKELNDIISSHFFIDSIISGDYLSWPKDKIDVLVDEQRKLRAIAEKIQVTINDLRR